MLGIRKFCGLFFLSIIFIFIVSIFFFFARYSFSDFGTIQQSYTFAETNALAKAFCDAISFLQKVIIPVAGISLSVAGIAAFQGKLNPIILVSLALGLAVVKDPGIFVNLILPNMGFQFGCKCFTEKTIYVRQYSGPNNAQYWQKVNINTGVDEDCNQIN